MAGSRFHAAIPARAKRRMRRRILERDAWRCVKCGRPGKLEVDHVVPLHLGGAALAPANLQTLCVRCHVEKTRVEKHGPPDPEVTAWRDYLREQSRR